MFNVIIYRNTNFVTHVFGALQWKTSHRNKNMANKIKMKHMFNFEAHFENWNVETKHWITKHCTTNYWNLNIIDHPLFFFFSSKFVLSICNWHLFRVCSPYLLHTLHHPAWSLHRLPQPSRLSMSNISSTNKSTRLISSKVDSESKIHTCTTSSLPRSSTYWEVSSTTSATLSSSTFAVIFFTTCRGSHRHHWMMKKLTIHVENA